MANYRKVARRKARKYGINPTIFSRQINQESGFNPAAHSPAGAEGIAQIMPATAASWGVNASHPRAALDAAAKHMADYLRAYHGSWAKALTAYNAGPGRVGGALPAETQNYIRTILGGRSDQRNSVPSRVPVPQGGGGGGSRQSVKIGQKTTTDEAGFEKARAGAVLGQLIARNHGTDSPLFKTGLLSTTMPARSDFTRTALTSKIVSKGGGKRQPAAGGGATTPDAPRSVGEMLRVASAQSRTRRPYQWGGGHGSTPAKVGTPVDCSGYVSMILGVSPRVSGQYAASFGKPGRGRQVTVYANSGHVLINIKGRWFATSHSNPGGGAGEISRPTASYLSSFTARHPRGL